MSEDINFFSSPLLFEFKPHPDITAYELALVIEAIQLRLSDGLVTGLPADAQRHFE